MKNVETKMTVEQAKAEIANANEPFAKVRSLFDEMKDFNFLCVYAKKGITRYDPNTNFDNHALCKLVVKMIDKVIASEIAGRADGYTALRFANDTERRCGSLLQFAVDNDDPACKWNVLITHDLNSINFNRRAVEYFTNWLLTKALFKYDAALYFETVGGNVEDYLLTIQNKSTEETAEVEEATVKDDDTATEPTEKELIEAEMRSVAEERDKFIDELEEAEANPEIAQSHIDYLKSEIAELGDRYQELWAQLDAINAAEVIAETEEVTIEDSGISEKARENARRDGSIILATVLVEGVCSTKVHDKPFKNYADAIEYLTVKLYLEDDRQWAIKDIDGKILYKGNSADLYKFIVADDGSNDDADETFTANVMPALDELNDHTPSDKFIADFFEEIKAEECDRNARFNHGERHAANLTAKLRKFNPNVTVTYDINEDDNDVFYLSLEFGRGMPFATLDAVESSFPYCNDSRNETLEPAAAEPVDEFTAELERLKAEQDAAKEKELEAKAAYDAAAEAYEERRVITQKFLDEHALKLCNEIQAITTDKHIKLINGTGGSSCTVRDFTNIYVDTFNEFGETFIIRYWNGRRLGRYDTPAQVEQVIAMLKAAIERGDTEFTFPTIEQLNTPTNSTDAEISDSLTRAMQTAEYNVQTYRRHNNPDGMRYEMELYSICADALNELKRRVA